MTDWYKMNPVDWNEGTDDLTLEQEGAYLRICNAIYISERPIRDNMFVIAGLLRCSDRKARRLVDELVRAGKLVIENGHILNRRAVDEVSTRVRLRMERQSTGSRGGIKSAQTRAKQLKSLDMAQANASSKNQAEEIRQEESREPLTPSEQPKTANPAIVLQSVVDAMSAQSFVAHCAEKRRPLSSQQAEIIAATLREVRALGGNPAEALRIAVGKGWVSLEIEYLRNAGMKFAAPPSAPAVDWAGRIKVWNEDRTWIPGWGPRPDEPKCEAPPELLKQAA